MAEKQEEVSTLERGNIYFFYRPKVEQDHPDEREDVQRFYMVLNPEDRERYRLLVIGQKYLPDPEKKGRGRNWGFVEKVGKNPKPIRESLEEESYSTKTRGERHVPAARPAGEGVYRILRHEDHTHLVYALELPRKPGDVQQDFEIEPEASYILSVKNPEKGSPRAAGLSEERQANFSKELMEKFRDRRFAEVDPPEFLDKEGAEIMLISAADDISEELGFELDTERENSTSAEIFKNLHVDKSELPTEPLLEAKWE